MASHRHHQQPQRATASRALPVINIGRLCDKDPASRALVVQDIAGACRDHGCFQCDAFLAVRLSRATVCFLVHGDTVEVVGSTCKELRPSLQYVIGHAISESVMNGALEAATEFFDMPTEHKEVFASNDIWRPTRYDTSARDGISKSRSLLKHYSNPLEDWIDFWPTQPASYRKKMGKYAVEVQKLSTQLMGAIVEGLGLGPTYLQEKLRGGLQFMALNSYPKGSSQAGDTVGLAPHSDYGFITILLQSSPGLASPRQCLDAGPCYPWGPPGLHVHLGDHLEMLSNGQLRSLVHQAILNTDEARISIGSIHGIAMDEKVDCAEELVDERHPRMYRESSFHDFLEFLPTNVKTYRRFVETLKIERD